MSFHLIVPSPFTALKETEFGAFIFCKIQLIISHLSQKALLEFQVLEWITKDCSEKNLRNTPFKSWFDRSMNAFSCIFSHSIGNRGNNNSTYFSLVILSLRSKCITTYYFPGRQMQEAHQFSNLGIGFIFHGINNSIYFSLFILPPSDNNLLVLLPRAAKDAYLLSNPWIWESKVKRFPGILLGNIYTTIWIVKCTLGFVISSITLKPYIRQKILLLWICCKCLVW